MNLIQNPQFIFDVRKLESVECCLAVIAQAFMDSCSESELHLGKVGIHSGWYLPGRREDMCWSVNFELWHTNDLFYADVLQPLDLVPPH